MEAFERLEVWQRSCRLSVSIYRSMARCSNYGYRDQVFRSALSVPSNIAEGYERNSRKEYLRFLRIAKGSCGELRTQLYIGKAAGLLDKSEEDAFIAESLALARMLQSMITTLETSIDT